jgi:prepilin-type N-terminal cleavage/methylation domain-containing protein
VPQWYPGGVARRRRPPAVSEDGFTILELTVVVAILGLLVAIAVPAFTSARATAQEHAAQADLRTAVLAANSAVVGSTDQSFDSVTPAVLAGDEPRLRWSTTEKTTGPDSVAALNGQVVETGEWAVGLVVQAGDGTCWYAFQADNDAPWYGAKPASGGVCDAADAGSFASSRDL